MGKLGRGLLWAVFPPAGAVATVNHRAQKRSDEQTQKLVTELSKTPDRRAREAEYNRRGGYEVLAMTKRMKKAGVSRRERSEAARRAYRLFMYDGATLEQAISAVEQRGSSPASPPQP